MFPVSCPECILLNNLMTFWLNREQHQASAESLATSCLASFHVASLQDRLVLNPEPEPAFLGAKPKSKKHFRVPATSICVRAASGPRHSTVPV